MVEFLSIGDEFPARYVPQSRYFQPQELDVRGYIFSPAEITTLNQTRQVVLVETFIKGQRESHFEVRL